MRHPEPDCWLHPDVHVGPSLIAGRGLFSTAPIPAGTVVSRLGGRLVSGAELKAMSSDPAVERCDSLVVDDDVHLVLPPAADNRFANHSCEPTMGWTDEFTLATLRAVAAGDELTVDYATSAVDADFVLYCHCETYRCRQVIVGDDWLIPQLQKRYAGSWTPYVQRRIDADRATDQTL